MNVLPKHEMGELGQSITFNCSYNGNPTPEIEWFKDGQRIMASSRVRLLPKTFLYIGGIERTDKGIYQCLVRNSHHSAQASAYLNLGGK